MQKFRGLVFHNGRGVPNSASGSHGVERGSRVVLGQAATGYAVICYHPAHPNMKQLNPFTL